MYVKILNLILLIGSISCTLPKRTQTPLKTVTINKPIIQNLEQVNSQLKKMKDSLVRITVQHNNTSSYGTGFFYKFKNMVVTNYHVIAPSRQCTIVTRCSLKLGLVKNASSLIEQNVMVSIVYQDPKQDLVFLKIEDSDFISKIKPIMLKNNNDTEKLTVVGFFKSNQQITFSKGKVLKAGDRTLTSIIIGSGFSGSPVINGNGELVGVVSSYQPIKGKQVGLAKMINIRNNKYF